MTTALEERAARLLIDPAAWADMGAWHEEMTALREATPAVRVEQEGFPPFVALLRYSDVSAVDRDAETWHNTSRSVLQPNSAFDKMVATGIPAPRTLVHLDGADHRDHRAVTNEWFKPAAVRHRQPRIDAIADEYIARLGDFSGECDFAIDIAQPFTLRVIMDIYGVPESDEALMLRLTQGLFASADPEFMEGDDALDSMLASVVEFIGYFGAITEDRRACPRDDLATVIATGRPGGHEMGEAERLWYYMIVATAGHDTTSFALSGGLHAILDAGDGASQLWELRQRPDLALNAAEESIRWTSPVRHFMRHAARDTEVCGIPMAEGDQLLLCYPSANRDASVFDDPHRFDVRRPNADKLISFGAGPHFCLGAQFARREVRTMLSRLASSLASVELAGPAQWSQSAFVSGVKHLPIRYRMR